MITKEEILLDVGRAHPLSLVLFGHNPRAKQVLIISSATGVLQHFYFKIAQYFAENGLPTLTFDYSGIGKSGNQIDQLKTHTGGLKSWGSIDQAAVVAYAIKRHPDARIHLMTHSIGGQLVGFNPNHEKISNIVMVASQGGYWKNFQGKHQLKLLLFWGVLIPASVRFKGYFASKKLGLFENLPLGMAKEWSGWGMDRKYFNIDLDASTHFFKEVSCKIRAYSFHNDSYAPPATVDWLTNQYPKAEVERIHYTRKVEGKYPGHFGFFRSSSKEALWKPTLDWLTL